MPTAKTLDTQARAWVRYLSPAFLGLTADSALMGSLGDMAIERILGDPKHGIKLGNYLAPLLDTKVTSFGLWKCGLSLVANTTAFREGRIPYSPECVAIPQDEKVLVKVVQVFPGQRQPAGWYTWNVVVLLADSPAAGTELILTMPEYSAVRLLRQLNSRLPKDVQAYPEYLTGNWARLVLSRRGRGYVIEKAYVAYEKANLALKNFRNKCKAGPCYKCPCGLDTCKYAIKLKGKT